MRLSDRQTPLNGIISPSERLITMQKQLEGTQKYINECADRAAHIDGQLMQLLWAIHTRFQRRAMPKVIKPEQSIYECLLGFVLTTFSAPPQILLHRQFSLSAQFQKRRNDGWWFLVLLLPALFWTVNVCWAQSCNKQGQRSSEWHFSWCWFHAGVCESYV